MVFEKINKLIPNMYYMCNGNILYNVCLIEHARDRLYADENGTDGLWIDGTTQLRNI